MIYSGLRRHRSFTYSAFRLKKAHFTAPARRASLQNPKWKMWKAEREFEVSWLTVIVRSISLSFRAEKYDALGVLQIFLLWEVQRIHTTLLISRLTSSHPSVFEERGDSMIILFVRHQMIFLWPLDIWNTDNRQFSANGPHRIASFISDKPPEQIYSFRSINDTNTMWRERVVSFEWRHSLQRCPNKPVWRRAEGCEVSGGVWLRLLLIPKTCVCLCLHLLSGCCEAVHELLTDRQTNSADF